jgi:hypothetical protein
LNQISRHQPCALLPASPLPAAEQATCDQEEGLQTAAPCFGEGAE